MGQDLGKKVNKKVRSAALAHSGKVRSAAYPLLDLGEAILAAKKIHENLGEGPHSRPALARGLGYTSFSGAVSGKVGALVHFGLLERAFGNYSITAAARALFDYPQTDCQKEIFDAAAKPALFRALAARFVGQKLPNDLAGILVSDYKIAKNAADRAAQNFVKTVEISGILKDGILVLPEEGGEAGMLPVSGRVEKPETGAIENVNVTAKKEGIKIKLSSGIEIIFPAEFALRLSMGEFAAEIQDLEKKTSGVE